MLGAPSLLFSAYEGPSETFHGTSFINTVLHCLWSFWPSSAPWARFLHVQSSMPETVCPYIVLKMLFPFWSCLECHVFSETLVTNPWKITFSTKLSYHFFFLLAFLYSSDILFRHVIVAFLSPPSCRLLRVVPLFCILYHRLLIYIYWNKGQLHVRMLCKSWIIQYKMQVLTKQQSDKSFVCLSW